MPRQRAATPRRGNRQSESGSHAPKAPRAAAAAAPKPRPGSTAAPAGDSREAADRLTEGLDRLDRERASSLADEGGASAAAVEAKSPRPATAARNAAGKLALVASWGLAGLAALYLRRSR